MLQGRGPGAVVNAACLESRRSLGSNPTLAFKFQKNKIFLLRSRVMIPYCGNIRDRDVACSASGRQGSNFESFVWKAMSSHHPHILAPIRLYEHKGGLKPPSFHFSDENCLYYGSKLVSYLTTM